MNATLGQPSGGMGVMFKGLWHRLRGKDGKLFPAMVRIRDASGQPVDAVEIEGRFEPSGAILRGRRLTAQGLCVFHWPSKAERLSLRFWTLDASGEVEVPSVRASPAKVIEVLLSPLERVELTSSG